MSCLSTTAQRYAVETCSSVAFLCPPIVMGTAKCALKIGSVPSLPGKTKSNRDQSSSRRFWIGAPDRMRRCTVGSCGWVVSGRGWVGRALSASGEAARGQRREAESTLLHAGVAHNVARACFAMRVTSASGLRIMCPSSSTAYPQGTSNSSSLKILRWLYGVMTTPEADAFTCAISFARARFDAPGPEPPLPAFTAESCRIAGSSAGAQMLRMLSGGVVGRRGGGEEGGERVSWLVGGRRKPRFKPGAGSAKRLRQRSSTAAAN